jgi:hypothetical protein
MRQATGFKSLANASQPSRNASNGIEPPPANVRGFHQPAANLKKGRVTRSVPVRKIADESEH